MSTPEPGTSTDDGVRAMLLLMPRLAGRMKRNPPPESLNAMSLAPRHLSLLSYLLFDGPMAVSELAARLEIAPTTVSLMVGDLAKQGLLTRREDPHDRRRTIVALAGEHAADVDAWLAKGARAWRRVLEPLTPGERELVVETFKAYERALEEG